MTNLNKFSALFEATASVIGAGEFAKLATAPAKKLATIRKVIIPDPCATPNEKCSDAALLKPEYQIVDFQYRKSQLENLLNWCNWSDDKYLGWRLVHGDTGRGKTRLMVELCAELNKPSADEDWIAGFLDVAIISKNPDALELLFACPKPLLIVVDYAERQKDIVTELLRRSLQRATGKAPTAVRLVFVSRRSTDLWDQIFRDDEKLHEIGRGELIDFILPPVTEDFNIRDIYAAAFVDFSKKLNRDHALPILDFSALGGEPTKPDIGLVHMLALMATLAPEEFTQGVIQRPSQDKILDFMLEREIRHWHKTAKSFELPTELCQDRVLVPAAVLLTLASQQGAIADAESARQVLRASSLLKGQTEALLDRVVSIFRETYPGVGFVNGVTPDLLGDYLIATSLEM